MLKMLFGCHNRQPPVWGLKQRIKPISWNYFKVHIYHYRVAKKLQAKLVLLTPSISEEKSNELSFNMRGVTKERFCKYFAPAMKNNLLEFVEIQISDEEIENIKNQV